jgi:GNAT superfamily N-acetyltransferase
MMVRGDLDDRGNPFYGGATRALFIAERGGRPVGRVTAIENRRHNEVHGDRVGFFGFFECIDDQEACDALMASAEGWLVGRGLDRARGPVNPSMHHECGLLVEGFEHAPAIMTPWSPPYYQSLLDRSGYVGERDLLGYYLPGGDKMRLPDRILRVAERKLQRTKLVFREWDFGTFEQEAHNVHTLYCEAWSGNWGFVPPTWEEFWHIAKDLKSVLHPKFAFVAEVEGETVGFVVIARDLNRVLRRIRSGRLWPWNIVRLFLGLPKVLSGRLVMLGLKREYRNRGFFSLVMYEIARRAAEIGAEGAEASWILEDNQALISPLKALGFEPYKRWRIYEKVLNPDRT